MALSSRFQPPLCASLVLASFRSKWSREFERVMFVDNRFAKPMRVRMW
jgi:hypothetical protein